MMAKLDRRGGRRSSRRLSAENFISYPRSGDASSLRLRIPLACAQFGARWVWPFSRFTVSRPPTWVAALLARESLAD